MAHRMKLEITEGDFFHLTVGGVVVDPVLVAAKAVARVQHRRVLVGEPRQFIQPSARERAEAIEMRPEPLEIVRRKIEREQIAQAAISSVKVLPGAVRRDVIGAAGQSRCYSRVHGRPRDGVVPAWCATAHMGRDDMKWGSFRITSRLGPMQILSRDPLYARGTV